MVRIAVDAMGGDHAPSEIVKGAVQAADEFGTSSWLVGPEDVVRRELDRTGYRGGLIEVVHAPQVVGMGEHGAEAVQKDRHRRETSILVATQLVKDGQAQAVVSAGSTGAQLAAAQLVLRRIKGVHRAAIASPFPTVKGACVLMDAGASPEGDVRDLITYALMGVIYATEVFGIPNPRVALLSNGAEPTKGTPAVVAAHQMLASSDLNFIGNIEGRDIIRAAADVVVCDGFTGNIVLKLAEGVGTGVFAMVKEEVRGIRGKLGAALLLPSLRRVKARMDYTEYGGAPLLGVQGVSIIAHGSSNAKAVKNAIRVAREAAEHDVIGRIAREVPRLVRTDAGEVPSEDERGEGAGE